MPEAQVMEPEAAAPPAEAQPDELNEVEPTTDPAEETEPTDQEGEPEPVKHLAEMSDEELEADERISNLRKTWESRASESARQSAEAETKKKAMQAAKDFQRTGQARATLNGAIAETINRVKGKLAEGDTVDSSELAIDSRAINHVTQQLFAASYGTVSDQWIENIENLWPKEAQMSKELIEMGASVKDGNYDKIPNHIVRFLDEYKAAAVEAELPKLKKQWEKERKENSKAEAELDRTADADARRDRGPTGGGGDSGATRTAREIFDDPKSSREDRSKAYEKLYGRKFEVIN